MGFDMGLYGMWYRDIEGSSNAFSSPMRDSRWIVGRLKAFLGLQHSHAIAPIYDSAHVLPQPMLHDSGVVGVAGKTSRLETNQDDLSHPKSPLKQENAPQTCSS